MKLWDAVTMDLVLTLTLIVHQVTSFHCKTLQELPLQADKNAAENYAAIANLFDNINRDIQNVQIQPYSDKLQDNVDNTKNVLQLMSLLQTKRNKTPLAIIITPKEKTRGTDRGYVSERKANEQRQESNDLDAEEKEGKEDVQSESDRTDNIEKTIERPNNINEISDRVVNTEEAIERPKTINGISDEALKIDQITEKAENIDEITTRDENIGETLERAENIAGIIEDKDSKSQGDVSKTIETRGGIITEGSLVINLEPQERIQDINIIEKYEPKDNLRAIDERGGESPDATEDKTSKSSNYENESISKTINIYADQDDVTHERNAQEIVEIDNESIDSANFGERSSIQETDDKNGINEEDFDKLQPQSLEIDVRSHVVKKNEPETERMANEITPKAAHKEKDNNKKDSDAYVRSKTPGDHNIVLDVTTDESDLRSADIIMTTDIANDAISFMEKTEEDKETNEYRSEVSPLDQFESRNGKNDYLQVVDKNSEDISTEGRKGFKNLNDKDSKIAIRTYNLFFVFQR